MVARYYSFILKLNKKGNLNKKPGFKINKKIKIIKDLKQDNLIISKNSLAKIFYDDFHNLPNNGNYFI